MFATPANAIRQKLQKSLTRGRHETTIARAVSSESLSVLLPNSQPSHVNCSVVWEQDIADSLLANLPSQLFSLSEECEITVDNITSIEDSTTSHTVSSSPKEKRVTRRRACHRQSLARLKSQPASSRRKKQKKSVRNSTINCARKTQDPIMEDNENTADHAIIVPDTQVETVTPDQDKKKKKIVLSLT